MATLAQSLGVTLGATNTNSDKTPRKRATNTPIKAPRIKPKKTPADITYPAALSATQLNATANTPGAFTYTPPATTVLNGGNAQTLSVNFVPTDTTNYNNASKNVLINVLKANQTITFVALSDRPLGTAPFAVGATSSSGLAVNFSI